MTLPLGYLSLQPCQFYEKVFSFYLKSIAKRNFCCRCRVGQVNAIVGPKLSVCEGRSDSSSIACNNISVAVAKNKPVIVFCANTGVWWLSCPDNSSQSFAAQAAPITASRTPGTA